MCLCPQFVVLLQRFVANPILVHRHHHIHHLSISDNNPTQRASKQDGDPDLYVSNSYNLFNYTVSGATSAAALFRQSGTLFKYSQRWGMQVEHITIPAHDSTACPQLPCRYAIAVYGYKRSSFSIVATMSHEDRIDELIPGTAQGGTVNFGKFAYYSVAASMDSGAIAISISVHSGLAGLYVARTEGSTDPRTAVKPMVCCEACVRGSPSPGWNQGCNQRSYLIDPQTYNYSSSWRSRNVVNIPASAMCENCYFIIGVYGRSYGRNTTFSITASSTVDVVTLQDGVAYSGHVDRFGYSYYRFTVSQAHSDLTISVVTFSGDDPDIYVGAYPRNHPNSTSYDYKETDGRGTLTIQLDSAPCVVQPLLGSMCEYYIGLNGVSAAADYTITADVDQGFADPQHLDDGVPVTDSVSTAKYKYYYLSPPGDDHEKVSIQLSPQNTDGNANLYVTFGPQGGQACRQNPVRSVISTSLYIFLSLSLSLSTRATH